MELLELTKKTSLQETDLKEPEFIQFSPVPEAESEEDDDEKEEEKVNLEKVAAQEQAQKKQMNAAMGAKNYLVGFFKDLGIDFQSLSREHIEQTFKDAKLTKQESKLFALFMDSQYAKSYQHFANMILKSKEEEEGKKAKEDSKQEEDVEMVIENEKVKVEEVKVEK